MYKQLVKNIKNWGPINCGTPENQNLHKDCKFPSQFERGKISDFGKFNAFSILEDFEQQTYIGKRKSIKLS